MNINKKERQLKQHLGKQIKQQKRQQINTQYLITNTNNNNKEVKVYKINNQIEMQPKFINLYPSQSDEFLNLSDVIYFKWYHYVLVELLMISPCMFIVFIHWNGVNILITMLIYFCSTLILAPYLTMKIFNSPMIKFLYNEFEHISKQIQNGFIFFLVTFFSVVLSYLFISKNNLKIINIPNEQSELFIVTTTMFFSLVYPIFEEWFWRIFLRKLLNPQEKQLPYLYISFHFAAFYGLIIYGLSGSIIKTSCFTLFFLLAHRLLQYIGDKSGVLSSMLTQMGLNISISIIIIDIMNRKK